MASRARRTFRSDNNAGICPEALRALTEACSGHAVGYGDDPHTQEAVREFRAVFGERVSVFFVPTGTIANTLSVAAMTEPWSRVLCHEHSHWNDDESTAPELFTGCRTTTIADSGSKLTPEDVLGAASVGRGDVHQPAAGALTISNPTEFGEVYTPEEVRGLCDAAHGLGYAVHVDGARFANAVAHLGCSAGELSAGAGVDALSFGGTKNGLALGEAALFFPQENNAMHERAVRAFPFLRKRAGALLSKHRYISAPFSETLRTGAWLRHAAHANEMATLLADGLADLGLRVPFSTESNGVFVEIDEGLSRRLHSLGHEHYMFGDPSRSLARLMCSFDTTREDVEALLSDAREAISC